ncbi:MAG: COX15/CtaA family protein [Myxococcota bacterium]
MRTMRATDGVPRLAGWIAASTVALMGLGGAVHATGSSLACPDWPLCYGQLLPRMVGGVALEHSHRLLASLVAGLTVLLAVLAHRRRDVAPGRARLAWLALALVAVQAVLGGVTVLLELSAVASTLHLGVSMLYLTTLTVVAVDPAPSRAIAPRRLRRWVGLAWGALFAQIVLGGLVRHTGAAMACGREPVLCSGEVWPGVLLAQLQMAHRAGAVLVAVLVVALSAVVAAVRPRAQAPAAAAAVLVLAQIGLGVWSVAGALPVAAVTLHLVVAALLLTSLTLLGLRLGMRRAERAPAPDPEERRGLAAPPVSPGA